MRLVTGSTLEFEDVDDAGWRLEDGVVSVSARPHSDFFIDPSGASGTAAESMLNAVRLLASPSSGDWQLSARVEADFTATFDAGVLIVWVDERRWAKLCFELSPAGQPMVVSVVTRGVSDDANSHVVHEGAVHLRVSKIGPVFAFHSSVDGSTWDFVRAFALDEGDAAVRVGFEAQSPMGDGCDVRFDSIRSSDTTLSDLRDGT